MKLTEKLAARIQRWVATPGEELGRWGRLLRFQVQLWRFCARRLRENNALAMSSALSFRTIFALIPLLVLALVVMKSMGLADQAKQGLTDLLAESGFTEIHRPAPASAPATGVDQSGDSQSVADYIEELVAEAENKLTLERIGPVGVVLLIWSALTLLTTMERSLNRIFGAPRSRAIGRRVMLYWSALTLGPVVIVAAIYSGDKVAESVRGVPGVSWLLAGVGWAGPVLLGVLLLAALYKLMPNTKVLARAALGGAAVAVILGMLAKWGFSVYVARLVGKDHFYGNLGLLPLFLMWLNLLWLVFLFGAELAHTAANLSSLQLAEAAENVVLGPSELLVGALAVAKPFGMGDGAVGFDKISAAANLPLGSLQIVLDRLAAGRVICAVDDPSHPDGAYVLARPAEAISLTEVLDLAPDAGAAPAAGQDAAMAEAIARARRKAGDALAGVTLAEIIADP